VTARWNRAEHILCVRLDTIGDVLMTGPALRALKESRPSRRLALLTSPAAAGAGRLLPGMDEVIVYDAPWMKATEPRLDSDPDRRMIELLEDRRFDAAVVFTVYSQSPLPAALLCHLAQVPLRLAHCREKPYQLLTDWVPEPEPEELVRHEVRRQLDLVATVGAHTDDERLRLELPREARDTAAAMLHARGVDRERPWIVVHPGSSAPSRRYPTESWASVCRTLTAEHGVQVVITGDAREVALTEAIRREAPAVSLAGEVDLAGVAGVLSLAPLLAAGNTGPVHVAAAVGTPVVDLYALTNPQHTPWGVPSRVLSHDVPCRWCHSSVCREGHHLCLRGVHPDSVVEAVMGLLQESGRLRGARSQGLGDPGGSRA
jgi:lipopolysaccharide heptosyltransferase II